METEKYFEVARITALGSDYAKTHLGCIAVYKGKIIGRGSNSEKTHPMQLKYNRYRKSNQHNFFMPKIHAEIKCLSSIHDSNIDYRKVKLYIYRVMNQKPYGMARPCPACMKAIKDLGIKQIYYTTDDGFCSEKLIN